MPFREKTSVTVDPALWHRFQVKIAVDQKKSTQALDEALLAWLDGGHAGKSSADGEHSKPPGPQLVQAPDHSVYPKRHENWHELLEIILESQTKHAIDAIQRNLEMFAFAVTVAGPSSAEEIRGVLKTVREGQQAADKPNNLKKPPKKRPNSA